MGSKTAYDIPIAKPHFSGQEIGLLSKILREGWLVQGPLVDEFERAVCERTQAKFGVATSSCTTALHLAMLISNIGDGDEVICPSYSFVATANAIKHASALPVFVDIDPRTLNLDPELVMQLIRSEYNGRLINRRTGRKLKAILGVHQIGIPADIDALSNIAKDVGVSLIEDAACAIGSIYRGQPIGSSGNINALSFHPRKVITTGEGGMLLTSSLELSDKARMYRAHGASLSDYARHTASQVAYESYEVVGYNYRMTDIQAALGISQLESLPEFVASRIKIGSRYNQAFSQIDTLSIITPAEYVTRWNFQSYPIRLVAGGQGKRDALISFLKQRGISTRRGIPPIHREPAYNYDVRLPYTDEVSQSSLFLPIFPQLCDEEVEHIIDSVLLGLDAVS